MEFIKIPKQYSFRNSVAILATEQLPLQDSTIQRDTLDYGAFNHFILKNFSTEKIRVKLDGSVTRAFTLNGSEQIMTDAFDNIKFNFLVIENLDAVAQIEIDEIDVTYMRKVV